MRKIIIYVLLIFCVNTFSLTFWPQVTVAQQLTEIENFDFEIQQSVPNFENTFLTGFDISFTLIVLFLAIQSTTSILSSTPDVSLWTLVPAIITNSISLVLSVLFFIAKLPLLSLTLLGVCIFNSSFVLQGIEHYQAKLREEAPVQTLHLKFLRPQGPNQSYSLVYSYVF